MDELHTKSNYDKQALVDLFEKTRYVESIIQLMKPAPPGKPKNWKLYRTRFVEDARIQAGVAFWNRNEEALQRAEQQFGVPAEIVVGLIGVETIYGKTTGGFRAMDALTTLAFSYPDVPNKEARMRFFRAELAQLLIWSKENNIDVLSLKSSYAGALGITQFMPSSVRDYAVDFDQDGKIDLKASEVDAIGSVANYLAKHGWKKGIPYVHPATLVDPSVTDAQLQSLIAQGLKASYFLDELKPVVSTADDTALRNIKYGLIDLQNGDDPTEYWLGSDNFFSITQYNRSYFYAMSVIDLGKVIAVARKNDTK